jgi:hypothetical protein
MVRAAIPATTYNAINTRPSARFSFQHEQERVEGLSVMKSTMTVSATNRLRRDTNSRTSALAASPEHADIK